MSPRSDSGWKTSPPKGWTRFIVFVDSPVYEENGQQAEVFMPLDEDQIDDPNELVDVKERLRKAFELLWYPRTKPICTVVVMTESEVEAARARTDEVAESLRRAEPPMSCGIFEGEADCSKEGRGYGDER